MMNENILHYTIKPGDTLEKIGNTIGMTGNQLKDFHNSHCDKMDRLWFDNLTGVRQVIIPKSYKSPQQLIAEKEKELPHSITRDFYAASYFVKETFSNISGNDLNIEYKINIHLKESQTNTSDYVADIRCYDFKKDGTAPDDKMSAISLACMESIYPVSFVVPLKGKMTEIFEFEKLKQRFEKHRPDLENFFVGDIYNTYLEKFCTGLEKHDYILKQFSSTLLYQLLFPKMDWFHKTNVWTEEFYFLQNSFPIKCSMSAEYDHEGTEAVKTFLKGDIQDAFSLQEILRGVSFEEEPEELANGSIELQYLTDKKTKKMLQAEASVSFGDENEPYRKQTLKLTHDEKVS
jgi:hypothetical protein